MDQQRDMVVASRRARVEVRARIHKLVVTIHHIDKIFSPNSFTHTHTNTLPCTCGHTPADGRGRWLHTARLRAVQTPIAAVAAAQSPRRARLRTTARPRLHSPRPAAKTVRRRATGAAARRSGGSGVLSFLYVTSRCAAVGHRNCTKSVLQAPSILSKLKVADDTFHECTHTHARAHTPVQKNRGCGQQGGCSRQQGPVPGPWRAKTQRLRQRHSWTQTRSTLTAGPSLADST